MADTSRFSQTEISLVDQPLIKATLTYDKDGNPIAFARGKVRERDRDVQAIKDWIRAVVDQVEAR